MKELFDPSNVIQILQIGVSGFSFLLAVLTFRLLNIEQGKDTVREPLLKTIRFYMIFAVFLSGLSLAGYLLPNPGELQKIIREQEAALTESKIQEIKMMAEINFVHQRDVVSVFDRFCKSDSIDCDTGKITDFSNAKPVRRGLSAIEATVCSSACSNIK